MKIEIKLNSKYTELPNLISQFESKAFKRANSRALRNALSDLNRKTKQELSQKYSLPERIFKPRVKTDVSSTKQYGKLWAGLNEFELYKLGKAAQMAHGVQVQNHYVPGGFIQTMPKTGKISAWERDGVDSLPIERSSFHLDDADKTVKTVADQYGLNRYRSELEIEIQKEIKRLMK